MTRAGEERETASRTVDGAQPKDRDRVGRLLKWVGAASAVLGLVFALVRATEMVTDRVERGRRLRELQQLAQRQLAAGDHRAAWASVQAASTVDPRRPEVRRLQEDVAMAWIRVASIRVANGDDGPSLGVRTFAELVDPLVATLDRGALAATGARQADLLAHRGWAEYLRGKVNSLMAKHTGRPLEQIERDFDRDNFMSADQAVAYGIVDQIVTSRQELVAPSAQPTVTA